MEYITAFNNYVVAQPNGDLIGFKELSDARSFISTYNLNNILENSPIAENAKTILAREGYDPVYGARPLKRYIQNTLENNLARRIIKGDIHYGSTAVIDGQNDEIIITTK